jgi:hypothetical protein
MTFHVLSFLAWIFVVHLWEVHYSLLSHCSSQTTVTNALVFERWPCFAFQDAVKRLSDVKCIHILKSFSKDLWNCWAGVFNSSTMRSRACWFSVVPDNELHPPGVPGLNQSLILEWTNKSVILAPGFRVEFDGCRRCPIGLASGRSCKLNMIIMLTCQCGIHLAIAMPHKTVHFKVGHSKLTATFPVISHSIMVSHSAPLMSPGPMA